MRKFIFTSFCLLTYFLFPNVHAQVLSGTITDEKNEPLPYASIYVKNSTKGTASNTDGAYILRLDPGSYEIVYQFIGYQTETRKINIDGGDQNIDIQLSPQSTELSEVVIAADREDPAYAIIRQAIKKRSYYKDITPSYECNVYVKGNQKILKAPEKILGMEVGDLDGMLDSTRKGIVYLSESYSKLYIDNDQYKEVITSSKISGDDRGYSFNSAKEMQFSFYENTLELQRQMVSPIANNALAYYKYRLEGVFQDEDGRLINQITVIPKRSNDPSFYGTIYIVDKLWNIHSLELGATSAATQVYFIDSLTFNQVYVPIEGPDKWSLFSNTISFKLGAFGFEMKGVFSGVYSDYKLNPSFEKGLFDQYVHVVQPESNERDSAYWEAVRPIPLTLDEIKDYDTKDSIMAVRKDPMYMDSVDRVGNKFNVGSIIGGYNYTRRSKRLYYSFASPLSSVQFNTVQGYNASVKFEGRKYFDEKETRRILFGANVNYGFSEKKVRANGYLTWRPSRLDYHQWTLSGGSDIVQFNRDEPISSLLNSTYSLFLRKNHAKFLDLKNLRLLHFMEPTPGVFVTSTLSWEERSPLENNSTLSYFRKEQPTYTSNRPLDPFSQQPNFEKHQAFLLNVNATILFKQKYFLYPDRKFGAGSQGPTLRLSYTGAFKVGGTDISFQRLAASLEDEWSVGVGGRFSWYINGGFFFNKERVEFRDFRHFNGSQIFIMNGPDYSRTFLQLPYYTYSTADHYFQLHAQHHFDGFLLDKIPGIQKLGWSLVAGAKFLKSGDLPSYTEFHLGLDNMGFKFVRLLRLDAVLSLSEGQTNWGARMSIGLN